MDLVKRKSARWHTIYSIISAVIEELAIVALVLFVLPLFNINIPLWGLIIILVCFAAYCYVMYRIGHPTISFREVSDPDSIVGSTGIAENELNPEGLIRIHGELWKAVSEAERLEKGSRVIVTGIDGLRLFVRKTD